MQMLQPTVMRVILLITGTIILNSVTRTVANKRAQLFRPYTSGHASKRRSYAREVHFRSSNIGSISGGGGPEKKPKFWNANFVCLVSMYAMKVPNSSEKQRLGKAGLGYEKLSLISR